MADRGGPRSRGVRLSDLDRSQVYLIGYSGRRWEVLGPVADAPAGRHAAPDGETGGEARRARTGSPPEPGGDARGLSPAP